MRKLAPLAGAGNDCLDVSNVDGLAMRDLPATRLTLEAPLNQRVRNGVLVKDFCCGPYLAEGFVQERLVLEEGFFGDLDVVLFAEGKTHKPFELVPF